MPASLDDADYLLADLTAEQREAVTTSATPLCVIAGAGSGKTRVITRRIAWQSTTGAVDPRRVLAVTFTRRAAGELRRRIRALGLRDAVSAGTFHAVSLAILRRHQSDINRQAPRVLESRLAFLARHNPKLDRATIANLDAEINWARARLVTPEFYGEKARLARRRPRRGADFTARLYADYEEAKRKRKLVDLDDILTMCHQTMSRDKKFGAAQRWRHQHLLVDEFQDINPLQFAVLQSWLGKDSTLVAVGDPNQAIYGWNGAEPDLLNRIDEHFPGTAVIHLRTNFRSTPEIIDAAAQVLLIESQPSARPTGDKPTVRELAGATEAAAIARSVRGRRKPGAPWHHQAILARTNAQLPTIRAALEKSGIPTRSLGSGALLRRPEIMTLIDEWGRFQPLAGVLADTTTGLPDAVVANLTEDGEALLNAFLAFARDHLALEERATVDEFLTSLRTDDRVGAAADGVELTTFHSAKGLEWPIVHLVGIEDGYVPIANTRNAALRAEEQRLLYVAATRAQRELHVSWCNSRMVRNSLVRRQPSPWLAAFHSTVEPLPDYRQSIADVRAQIAPASTIDSTITDHKPQQQVRDQLLSWRDNMAKFSAIAPNAVLSDRTVEELAAIRPCSIDELAAIDGLGASQTRRFGLKLLEITCLDK